MNINPIGAMGGLVPMIVVTAPTGSTVTCDGVQGTEVAGTWTFKVVIGTHTIVATLGTDSRTETVIVDKIALFTITISYSPIPSWLQAVEYLRNDGYAYIVAGSLPVSENYIDIHTKFIVSSSAGGGRAWRAGGENYEILRYWDSTYPAGWHVTQAQFLPSDIGSAYSNNGIMQEEHSIANNGSFVGTVKNATFSTGYSGSVANNNEKCSLFCAIQKSNGAVQGSIVTGDFYNFYIQNANAEDLIHLYPVYTKTSGKGWKLSSNMFVEVDVQQNTAGVYNTVDNKLYINSGFGTFSVGQPIDIE